MKRIIFTLAALMTMTVTFAEERSNENASVTSNEEKYDFNINMKSLANTLKLDNEETYTVSLVTRNFTDDMKKAGEAVGDEQKELSRKAVNRNLSYMHSVLTPRQYNEYALLLKTTLENRGLDK